jgi:hypothetical protein
MGCMKLSLRALLVTASLAGGLFGCQFKQKDINGNPPPFDSGVMDLRPAVDFVIPDRGPATECTNLQCRQTGCTTGNCTAPKCNPGERTTVSGVVYDPAGKVPLYNIYVYVPNKQLADLPEGPSCDTCANGTSGDPVVVARTDAKGQFELVDVPVGANVPLVIQAGKWRRETTLANVTPCQANVLTDHDQTRLPRNKSEGHLPKIALTTGGLDALECLLRKIGIDDAEITNDAGTGRVNLFAGGNHNGTPMANNSPGTNMFMSGEMMTDAETWWEQEANLNKYDIILHSCEGTENPTNKSMAARQALQNYANAGGRVFASHWHNYWIEQGIAPWPSVATFRHRNNAATSVTATVDQSFPKGAALAEWLLNVQASTTLGQLPIMGNKHTVDGVNAAVAQRWIYNTNENPNGVEYLSFLAPVMPAAGALQCGKVVFSDLHVSAGGGMGDTSAPAKPFPTGCVTADLSPQEKALEFMLFDLSSCVEPAIP